jgi:hypothetical protein
MTTEQFNIAKKYPFILDECSNTISLRKVSTYLTIINAFDKSELKLLKLENFKEDIKYIFNDIKEERKRKLNKINQNEQF